MLKYFRGRRIYKPMNYNIIKNIIRQELRRINEANEPESEKDLEKAEKALDKIKDLIEELGKFKTKLSDEFNLLESGLGLTLEDVVGNPDGIRFFRDIFSDNTYWTDAAEDILDIQYMIEEQMEEEEDLSSDPKEIAQKIKELNLVDEYLTMDEADVNTFYLDELGMEMPSQKVDGEVFDILNKENRRGFSSEYGG